MDKHRVKLSSFMTGQAVDKAPDLAGEIVRRGHEAAAHGRTWQNSYLLDPDAERRFIDTRLTQAKVDENNMEIGGEKVQLGIPEQMRQMASMLIPLGRPASPEEAAGGVFFLCTPWSNYVHGQTLHITGGLFGGMSG